MGWISIEWWRRCFQEEEPEIPEEIKDMILKMDENSMTGAMTAGYYNQKLIEAYRRGLRKGEK